MTRGVAMPFLASGILSLLAGSAISLRIAPVEGIAGLREALSDYWSVPSYPRRVGDQTCGDYDGDYVYTHS